LQEELDKHLIHIVVDLMIVVLIPMNLDWKEWQQVEHEY
jgi:hypothetical protein